jgi:hypothetical protein
MNNAEPIVFVTSLNQKLFFDYGENFINSWLKKADLNLVLVVVHEEPSAPYLEPYSRNNVIPMSLDSAECDLFKHKFQRFHEARGVINVLVDEQRGISQQSYNYRFDAIRFSFKIFSLMKVLRAGLVKDKFAWIDADMLCLEQITSAQIGPFFPEGDEMASYLGRESFPMPNPYSECGFVGYQLSHPSTSQFFGEFEDIYLSGNIFLLKEWHDCMVFDFLRLKYEQMGACFKNLAAHNPHADHPFSESGLAQFFDHLKGPERKRVGHS